MKKHLRKTVRPVRNSDVNKRNFTATFRLYKFGNFVMEDQVTMKANNKKDFIRMFGYQTKLHQANKLVVECGYTLEISINNEIINL